MSDFASVEIDERLVVLSRLERGEPHGSTSHRRVVFGRFVAAGGRQCHRGRRLGRP